MVTPFLFSFCECLVMNSYFILMIHIHLWISILNTRIFVTMPLLEDFNLPYQFGTLIKKYSYIHSSILADSKCCCSRQCDIVFSSSQRKTWGTSDQCEGGCSNTSAWSHGELDLGTAKISHLEMNVFTKLPRQWPMSNDSLQI